MFVRAVWITFIVYELGISLGNTYSDIKRCTRNENRDSVYKNHFCMVTKDDVYLSCPGNKKIVLLSLQFALKSAIKECTKRILNSQDKFCCTVHNDDILYGGECLQEIWNIEDRQHFHQFMNIALSNCNNKKTCVLGEEMFMNLQKEIPETRMFSSYFEIHYNCKPVPSDVVDLCSERSVSATGQEIHIQSSMTSNGHSNKNCTCHVTSDGNAKVNIKAVDIRTTNSVLLLNKNTNLIKDLTQDQQPLFGFKEMATEREFDITLVRSSSNTDNSMWIVLSGSNGQDVHINCKGNQQETTTLVREMTTHAVTTTTLAHRETPAYQEVVSEEEGEFLEDYWPMIYLGAGSGITIVLVVCVVGSILICRYSMMKEKRKGQYGNPYRHSQVNYNRSGQYDTVLDDMQHIPGHMVASNQETLEWR